MARRGKSTVPFVYETAKGIGGKVVQKRKSILNFLFPNGTMVHYTRVVS